MSDTQVTHEREPTGPTPRISVVVAAYNCDQFLPHTIASIQAQTVREWECIIVDDGSADRTLEVARDTAKVDTRFHVATQANSGPAAARNRGLAMIDPASEFVIIMDSDDVWLPEALQVLMETLQADPGAVGAHALGQCIDQDGNPYKDPTYSRHGSGRFICGPTGKPIRLDPQAPTTFQSLWFSNPFPPGLVLIRCSAFAKTGSFDSSVCPVEDWDILIRLSRHGNFRFIDRILISYRRHPNNLSGRSSSQNDQQVRNLLHKTFFSKENDASQKRIVRANWRATQFFHLRSKFAAWRYYIARARFGSAAAVAVRISVNFFRLARGYPTLRGI